MKFVKQINPDFVEKYRDQEVPWGPVGYVTYKRTYSRPTLAGPMEEWYQTVGRCVNGLLHIGGAFEQSEVEKLYHYVFNLKCNFSGRAMWQLGTDTVDRLGGDSLQNCWHVAVNDPVEAFTFTFNELMLGGGVGFNITPEYVYEMPAVKFNVKVERVDDFDCDYIATDNREGWVELLERILRAFYFTGKNIRYNTFAIRAKGKPIKSFGGTASGSEDLVKGLGQIVNILRQAVGRKLKPVECLDIMNIIGSIVVAGNVRRSAEIACGSPFDLEFLNAKNWSRFKLPPWRQMSNNSVLTDNIHDLPSSFWDGYEGKGEPYGLVNLPLCRRLGRLYDGDGYRPDLDVIGVNPCGEIPLASHEACNLAELYLPNLRTPEEFRDAGELMYKSVKTISMLPFINSRTNAIVSKNRRLGIGATGYCAAPLMYNNPGLFDAVYKHIEDVDVDYSKQLRSSESIKLTTVKPSGTSSLLPGVPPGVHPEYAPFYLRRITFSASNPLVDASEKAGFHVEPKINIDGSRDHNTMIVTYPVKARDGAITASQLTAIDQLENQKFLQTHWSDNAVSMTCYYKPEELPGVIDWLGDNFTENVKSASFLLHSGHGFVQAPYEPITEEHYNRLKSVTTPITRVLTYKLDEAEESLECPGGNCPLK